MQQAHGVLFVVIRAKRIGTHHFPQQTGLVGKGPNLGPHFVDNNVDACVCSLPSRFGPGHAAANDVESIAHEARCRAGRVQVQRRSGLMEERE